MGRNIVVGSRVAGLGVLGVAIAAAAVAAMLTTLLDSYRQVLAAQIALSVIVAVGVTILVGVAGLLSLATAAFAGAGAYGTTILMLRTEASMLVIIPGVVAASWLFGWLVGTFSLRVAGLYLALVTLGVLTLFKVLLLRGGDLTGAGYGLVAPIPSVGGRTLSSTDISMLTIGLAAAVIVVCRSFLLGRVGRSWRIMKASPVAAELAGVNLARARTSAFASTSALAALSGCLSPLVLSAVNPDSFGLGVTIEQLIYVVVGGLGSVLGATLGVLLLNVVPLLVPGLGEYRELFYGAMVLVILIAAPRGIAGLLKSLSHLIVRPWTPKLDVESLPVRVSVRAREVPDSPRPGVDPAVPTIRFNAASVSFGGLKAVDDLTFDVLPGHFHGLIGPNGAGKTTAINAVTRQVSLSGGSIQLLGKDIASVPARRLATLGVSRTFQTPLVAQDLSILENVMLGLYSFGRAGLVRGAFQTPRAVSEEAHARARATDALDRVKFEAARRTPVSSLSFGDLRKLEIARALVGRPRLLLLDEPTSGLEPASAEDILIRLRELQGEGSEPMTVLLIEHNVPLVFAHSDRVTAMAAGSAVVTGTPDEVRVNPEVRSSYLGEQIELAEETASLVPPTGKS